MESSSSPRITCAYLNSYVGKNVIVVGKVLQLRGEEAVIDADGNITAYLNRVSRPFPPRPLQATHPPASISIRPFFPSPPRPGPGTANRDEGVRGKKEGTEGESETANSEHPNADHLLHPARPRQQEAHLSAGNGVQIIGKVNPDLSIKVLSSMDLGTSVGE